MNSKSLVRSLWLFAVVALVAATSAFAQRESPVHLRGLINDYSPSTVKGGPYEIRGDWSLNLHGESGTADFTADLNMETSEYGIQEGIVDPAQPASRGAHTHHVEVKNGKVTWNMDGCPAFNPPTKVGFQINGPVSLLTGNGSNAPFETTPPTTTVQICITGGNGEYSIPFSNFTMVFAGPATKHFGVDQAIHGVVRMAK